MTIEKIIKFLKEKWISILLFGAMVGALSFFLLVFSQKNYRTSLDLLITQNQNGYNDYYALSKSADYLSSIVIEAVYSERFLEEMGASGVNTTLFLPENKVERLKVWKKTIQVSKNANLGIVNIMIYSNSQAQSQEIADSVVDVLTNKYFIFLGKGQDLDIRLLNGPLTEKNPSLSEILAVIGGGIVLGIIIFIFTGLLLGERKKPTKLFFHENLGIISEEEMAHKESLDYWSKNI